MPWTGEEFRAKHDKSLSKVQAAKAAKMANAMLKAGTSDGVAIATAIKRLKSSPGKTLYGEKK